MKRLKWPANLISSPVHLFSYVPRRGLYAMAMPELNYFPIFSSESFPIHNNNNIRENETTTTTTTIGNGKLFIPRINPRLVGSQSPTDIVTACFSLLQVGRIEEALHLVSIYNHQMYFQQPQHHQVNPISSSSHPSTDNEEHQLKAKYQGIYLPSVSIANGFIEALLNTGDEWEAWEILESLGLHADAISFGLFCRHYLINKEYHQVQYVLNEMNKRSCITLPRLMYSGLFSNIQMAQLRRLESTFATPPEEIYHHHHHPIPDHPMIEEDINEKIEPTQLLSVQDSKEIVDLIKSVESRHGGINYIKQSLQSLEVATVVGKTIAVNSENPQFITWQKRIEHDCLNATISSMQAQWTQRTNGTTTTTTTPSKLATSQSMDASSSPSIITTSFFGHKWLLTTWARELSDAIEETRKRSYLISSDNSRSEHGDNSNNTRGEVEDERFLLTLVSPLSSEKVALITLQQFLNRSRYTFEYCGHKVILDNSYGQVQNGSQDNESRRKVVVPSSSLWPATTFTSLCGDIGRALEAEVFAEQILKRPFLKTYFEKRHAFNYTMNNNHNNHNETLASSPTTINATSTTTPFAFYENYQRQLARKQLVRQRSRQRFMSTCQDLLSEDVKALADGWIPSWTAKTRFLIGSLFVDLTLKHLNNHWSSFALDSSSSGSSGSNVMTTTTTTEEDSSTGKYLLDKPFVHQIISHNCKSLGVVRIDRRWYDKFTSYSSHPYNNNNNDGDKAIEKKGSDVKDQDQDQGSVGVDYLLQGNFITPWALPMVCTPRPWTSVHSGGYLAHQFQCVRTTDRDQDLRYHDTLLEAADQQGHLKQMFEGLTFLGNTPWCINQRILDVAIMLWNQGHSLVDSFDSNKNGGDLQSEYQFIPKDQFPTHQAYVEHVRRQKQLVEDMQNSHSTRCDVNYKLEIARAFRDVPSIYFPHNVDFRSRAYPIAPHLNHIGSDLSRGLLWFAEAKPLGNIGFHWLKVQLANMIGKDKLPFKERADYVDSQRHLIEAVAENPFGDETRHFWQRSDEPWQCLAACLEVNDAWKYSYKTGDSTAAGYLSRLPVQQDGSCNGLQHYAALGGDTWGASQVNLLPSIKPQDIYNTVAQIVNRLLQTFIDSPSTVSRSFGSDDKNGINNCDQSTLSRMILDVVGHQGVSRKIVKTPVMTNVYGVTSFGARKQIASNLQDMYGKDVFGKYQRPVSSLLTKLVFEALDGLFTQATAIKRWFEHAAGIISTSSPSVNDGNKDKDHHNTEEGSKGSVVMWTTPLGFPVLQPYFISKKVTLKTSLQTITLNVDDITQVDGRKQVTGIAPNFVHSLDATHMFLTALRCRDRGLTFASVHDCFWTHAGDVPTMAKELREAFVELHSQPILDNLRQELLERYQGYHQPHHRSQTFRLPEVPKKGDLDLTQVLKSDYFFS